MGSKGSQKTESTSTQQTSADPRAQALYTDVLSRAEAAAQQPYQAYQGQLVAGFTPDQLAAMQGVRDVQGAYAPYFQTAAQYGQAAGQAISPSQIQQAMSPYIQGVIQPTLDVMTAEGQKAIVLGAKGSRIKEIGAASRKELEEMLGRRIHLFLFVKVRENWSDDPERYRDWGLDYKA